MTKGEVEETSHLGNPQAKDLATRVLSPKSIERKEDGEVTIRMGKSPW